MKRAHPILRLFLLTSLAPIPPIAVFSPSRSGRTGAHKDTYNNVKKVNEVVINLVDYSMVEQMSLASSPYGPEVDEFIKSGLTPIESETIKPFRVKESPVQLECKVIEVKELGEEGGAGKPYHLQNFKDACF